MTSEPAQMSGLPLQVGDLPPGTVAVRIIRNNFSNNIAGQSVTLTVGTTEPAVNTTSDSSGRAVFNSLRVGSSVRAKAVVDGEVLESQQFELPAQGGVRLVLVAGVGAGAGSDAAKTVPEMLFSSPSPIGNISASPPEPSNNSWPIFAGLMLLSAVGTGAWWLRHAVRKTPERAQLFETLVQVEKSFREKRLEPDLYHSRREELIDRIARLDASLD
ncbi:MAG: carboxypeptidase-like regulatory domain-containing protein [Vicinamibacterales bacterium]|nr:carboxypeptidase-like regulatory domain-containing protein [Vicinamibacterales bacterium]